MYSQDKISPLTEQFLADLDLYIQKHYINEEIEDIVDFTTGCRPYEVNCSVHYVEEAQSFPSEQSKATSSSFTAKASPMIKLPAPKKKRSLDEVLKQPEETFQQMLLRLIQEKGEKNSHIYKKANQDRQLFSRIRKDIHYQPKKNTAIAFALALELNLDQTKDLLGRAGYALSPSSKFDLVIQYFIENEVYDIYAIEDALDLHGLPLLCNY